MPEQNRSTNHARHDISHTHQSEPVNYAAPAKTFHTEDRRNSSPLYFKNNFTTESTMIRNNDGTLYNRIHNDQEQRRRISLDFTTESTTIRDEISLDS